MRVQECVAQEEAVLLFAVGIDILKFDCILETSGSTKQNLINAGFHSLYLLFSVKLMLCICKP